MGTGIGYIFRLNKHIHTQTEGAIISSGDIISRCVGVAWGASLQSTGLLLVGVSWAFLASWSVVSSSETSSANLCKNKEKCTVTRLYWQF